MKFIRKMPDSKEYHVRLDRELEIINKLGFKDYFNQVQDILSMTSDIPHLTRGSAGCSLVAYLMGITDIDPIAEDIDLDRFMHELRTDTPDIDIDFAWYDQPRVLERIYTRWPRRAYRISNHIKYKAKSALRQAMRDLGYVGNLPRGFDIEHYLPGKTELVKARAEELQGQYRHRSKHPGGVVIFEDKPNPDHICGPTQVNLDKREVEDLGLLKIDILSNRGLGQLLDISRQDLTDYPETDQATCELLQKGDTLGVTQAESPAFRKMLRALQPRSRNDLIVAMALIRPAAASRGRKSEFLQDWKLNGRSDLIIYEDDANRLIQKAIGCTGPEADMYRRAFAKENMVKITEFAERVSSLANSERILEDLGRMKEYSLCKAHAISYGRMVWALAYHKAHNPVGFWHSALKNCQSMYRRWVHVEEARLAGVKFENPQMELIEESQWSIYRRLGYWYTDGFLPGMYDEPSNLEYRFRGLIATHRRLRKTDGDVTFATLGYAPGKYLDIVIPGYLDLHHKHVIEGQGFRKNLHGSEWIDVYQYSLT